MVGEMFADTARMIQMRQQAAQSLIAQNHAIENVNAAKAEAERHAARGSFTTVPTANGQIIVRQNQIGYTAPSLSSFRSMTPLNSPIRQAMSPSMQPPSAQIMNGLQVSKSNNKRFV